MLCALAPALPQAHGRRLQAECVFFLPAFAAASAAVSLLAVNLAAVLLDVRLRSFATATPIGVIPGTLAYASVGEGLDCYFETRAEVSLGEVLSSPMIAVRVGLALLALLPVAMQRARKSWPS